MPKLREASAPKIRPMAVVIRIASTIASSGFQPSVRPLVSPPAPPRVTMFPSMYPGDAEQRDLRE